MAITIDGTAGTIAGLVAGGLPDASILAANIAPGVIPVAGITEIDIWKLNNTISAQDGSPLTDFSKMTSLFSTKGTGMTMASGLFTFPSTGYWQIIYKIQFGGATVNDVEVYGYTQISIDSGSNWIVHGVVAAEVTSNPDDRKGYEVSCIVDVSNISTTRARFDLSSNANEIEGGGNGEYTAVTFIRLGDR